MSSSRQSITPEGFPVHPTRVVVTGYPPGPEAQAIVDQHQAELRRFHSAQQQNVAFAQENGVRVHRAHATFGNGTRAVYSNIFGQERLELTVRPTFEVEEPRPAERSFWKWALIELVIENMVGFDVGIQTILKSADDQTLVLAADDDEARTELDSTLIGELEEASYTKSLLVDLRPFAGSVVEVELRGFVNVLTVIGGDGDLSGQQGEIIDSDLYGALSIGKARDGNALDGPTFTPSELENAPRLPSVRPEFAGNETIENRLIYTFPEFEDAGVFTARDTDHRQDILWLSNWFGDSSDDPTEWTFYNPQPGSTVSPPWIIKGVDPNDYSVFPAYTGPVTTYWDDDNTYVKKIDHVGTLLPPALGGSFPVPSNLGVNSFTANYYNGADYYVPTWRYDSPRTANIFAVCARESEWGHYSRNYKVEERTDPDNPLDVESFRWETAGFPARPSMSMIGEDVSIEVIEDGPAPLIGTLKIDTNSGTVEFEAGV